MERKLKININAKETAIDEDTEEKTKRQTNMYRDTNEHAYDNQKDTVYSKSFVESNIQNRLHNMELKKQNFQNVYSVGPFYRHQRTEKLVSRNEKQQEIKIQQNLHQHENENYLRSASANSQQKDYQREQLKTQHYQQEKQKNQYYQQEKKQQDEQQYKHEQYQQQPQYQHQENLKEEIHYHQHKYRKEPQEQQTAKSPNFTTPTYTRQSKHLPGVKTNALYSQVCGSFKSIYITFKNEYSQIFKFHFNI